MNEKLENISLFENDNDKTKINNYMNLLDKNILKDYSNKKFKKIKSIHYYEIDSSLIPLNYYDNIEGKQNESIMIYNKFEIIDKNALNIFIQNTIKYNKNLTKCIFNNAKIFINMPNNLNNRIASLIGILEPYYNYFIIENILIYNNEDNRNEHIKEIISNLDEYLNNLNFLNNNSNKLLNNSETIGQ